MHRGGVVASVVLAFGLTACSAETPSDTATSSTVATTTANPSSSSTTTQTQEVADFPENATMQCFDGDRASVAPDRVRQVVGGKTSCELLGALRAEVESRRAKGKTDFMVEALSTKANAVRRFDCKSENGLTECIGRKPSQAHAWVADAEK